MPAPHTLISSYPSNDLGNLITKVKPSKLHVYVDLKNVLTAIFIPKVVNEIVVNTSTMSFMDSSIFQSCLNFASFWRRYGYKFGLECEVFFCTDIGRSVYHLNIDKKYKANREIAKFGDSLVHDAELKNIRDKNFILAEQVCNMIPNVHFFCLRHLESDFLPYYLMSRYYKETTNVLHIVCSNDKDLLQAILRPFAVQIFKNTDNTGSHRNILTKKMVLSHYTKIHKLKSPKSQIKNSKLAAEVDPNWITGMMSCVGDGGDDVDGVKGIGELKALEIFHQKSILEKTVGTPSELEDRISSGGQFFLEDQIGLSQLDKNWQKVFIENPLVTKAYKLISLESLCRWMEKQDTTEKTDYIRYIDKILTKTGIEQIPSHDIFLKSLEFLEDFQLNENVIPSLFGGS